MESVNSVITSVITLEGLLRVYETRHEPQALAEARRLAAEISAMLDTAVTPAGTPATPAEPAAAAPAPVPEPQEEEAEVVAVEESEPAPAPAPSPAPAPAPAPTPAPTPAPVNAAPVAVGDIRRSLTLNDKFRFIRELFGGSDVDFNGTLDLIATMHSPAEAREYLLQDLAWDAESPLVADFLAYVDNYFTNGR